MGKINAAITRVENAVAPAGESDITGRAPAPEPGPGPEQGPEPEQVPEPYLELESEQVPEPGPGQGQGPEPVSEPEPEPEPEQGGNTAGQEGGGGDSTSGLQNVVNPASATESRLDSLIQTLKQMQHVILYKDGHALNRLASLKESNGEFYWDEHTAEVSQKAKITFHVT